MVFKRKRLLYYEKNAASNKDDGVEKKEQKVVSKIQGYQEAKKTDDFNDAARRQIERNTEEKKSRKSELNETGIRTGHAYAILRCFENDGHKFVTLRDPYGVFRRKYDVTKEDGKIVDFEKKNASNISLPGTDTMGMFNMELNDFLTTFNYYSGIKRSQQA